MEKSPRYHIVSLRINSEERAVLDEISRRTLKTVSAILREAMEQATEKWSGFTIKSKRRRDTHGCRKVLHQTQA